MPREIKTPRSHILGTGRYVPARVVTNAELEARVDTTDGWIRRHTGIERRHVAAPGEQTSDMAAAAGKAAIEAAGLTVADLDMIILATTSGDTPMPATAVLVQLDPDADEEEATDRFRAALEGTGVRLGGGDVVGPAIGSQVSEDLARAEMIAFPILFALSLWVFRGFVAALMPPLMGALAIVAAFLGMRAVDSYGRASQLGEPSRHRFRVEGRTGSQR